MVLARRWGLMLGQMSGDLVLISVFTIAVWVGWLAEQLALFTI